MIASITQETWQALVDRASKDRPNVGKCVRVTSGKHSGKTGTVVWHGINKFSSTQFKTNAQLDLRDARGREGYRVGILCDDGSRFFVDADKVDIL